MPLDEEYIDQIKQFEGFNPHAFLDGHQYSIGYGTVARSPTETIDQATADTRLRSELGQAETQLDKILPTDAPPGVRAALTSLTYNNGGAWMRQGGLSDLVKRGDWNGVAAKMPLYDKGLPAIAKRRAAEAKWITDGHAKEDEQKALRVNLYDTANASFVARSIQTQAQNDKETASLTGQKGDQYRANVSASNFGVFGLLANGLRSFAQLGMPPTIAAYNSQGAVVQIPNPDLFGSNSAATTSTVEPQPKGTEAAAAAGVRPPSDYSQPIQSTPVRNFTPVPRTVLGGYTPIRTSGRRIPGR